MVSEDREGDFEVREVAKSKQDRMAGGKLGRSAESILEVGDAVVNLISKAANMFTCVGNYGEETMRKKVRGNLEEIEII